MRKVEAGGAILGQRKREREQDTQMFRKKPGAPRGLAPVCNGLQPSLGLRSTRGSRPRDTWTRVLAQPRDAGSAGPLPPDSLFKAVRGGEHPAAVEQARSAEVGAPQTQAALPRPVPER